MKNRRATGIVWIAIAVLLLLCSAGAVSANETVDLGTMVGKNVKKETQPIKVNKSYIYTMYTEKKGKKLPLRKGTYYLRITRDIGMGNYNNGWIQMYWK